MSVYNGAEALPRTLESVLSQEGVDFEFIVIDDGSTDASSHILDEWAASHPRLRVIHQKNTGLTRALIRGCAEARGEFIARQDCGDISLPGRLAAQVAALTSVPTRVMVACGCEHRVPSGEWLGVTLRPGAELGEGLARLDVRRIVGPPHHGSVMFRRDAYLEVGGYRDAFAVAQDIDLWLRLAEQGALWGMDEVLYAAEVAVSGISARRRDEQRRAAGVAIACAVRRREGGDDLALLATLPARRGKRSDGGVRLRRSLAAGHYFLATRLAAAGHHDAALQHLREALRAWPLSARTWWRWLRLRGALAL